MKWKLADGTEVDLGDVTLEQLEADPAIKEQLGSRIQGAIKERFDKKKAAPPPPPVVPPEMVAELEELRAIKAKFEDSQKTEIQRAHDAAQKIGAEKQKEIESERKAREAAERALHEERLDAKIRAFLINKNKGIGVEEIPPLVRANFKTVEGKYLAENPETGAPAEVEEFLPAFLKAHPIFLPPPLPGSGQQPGGKPGTKAPENLTPGQWLARAVAEKTANMPPGEALNPDGSVPGTKPQAGA